MVFIEQLKKPKVDTEDIEEIIPVDPVASTRILEERYDQIRSRYLRNKEMRNQVRKRDASEQASDEDFKPQEAKKSVD